MIAEVKWFYRVTELPESVYHLLMKDRKNGTCVFERKKRKEKKECRRERGRKRGRKRGRVGRKEEGGREGEGY